MRYFLSAKQKARLAAAALILLAIVSGCSSSAKKVPSALPQPVGSEALSGNDDPAEMQQTDAGEPLPTEPFHPLSFYEYAGTVIAAGYFEGDDLMSLIDNQTQEVIARNLYRDRSALAYETGQAADYVLLLLLDIDTVDVFDMKTLTFLHRNVANYENYRNGGNGMLAVQEDGYWGYVSVETWEMEIPPFFESAGQFFGNRATVREGGKCGVIDEKGNYILMPDYTDMQLDPDHSFIYAYVGETTVHLFNYNGRELLPRAYDGYTIQNEKIYALDSEVVTRTEAEAWYALFDLEGNSLAGEGSTLERISRVTLPVNGRSIGYGYTTHTNVWFTSKDEYYLYLDENAAPISEKRYSEVTYFNSLGYSIALDSETYNFNENTGVYQWVVVDRDGNEVHVLPVVHLGEETNKYLEANDYYAYGHGTSGLSPDKYALVDLSTDEVIYLPGPATFLEGTNCIAVYDTSRKLFGLYDGREQVYDYLYNDIYFDMASITLTRGSTTSVYTPKPRS